MPRRSLKKQAKEHKGEYVTRAHAIKYLQVSLNDFRRLCILKGIYPRDLQGRAKSHVQKGSTRQLTVYYRKDIQYLAHEPLLRKFREHKIFSRKLTKALGRGDLADARRVDANRPRYTLDHIVKERYPTFLDAVGDMDDALSTLFLFAVMPATDKVTHRITAEAERLSTEWMAFVAREHLLRKVFVSIKGVYYQAVVRGQEVTWVVPFKFPQAIPDAVDFDIMLTFLEFYTTLVHFVLFKLYTDEGLVYPPPIDAKREKGVGGMGTYLLKSQSSDSLALPEIVTSEEAKASQKARPGVKISLDKAKAADRKADDRNDRSAAKNADESDEDDETGAPAKLDEFKAEDNSGDLLAQPSASSTNNLFSKFTFFVGREVPLDIVEFVVLAFGGKLISEAALDEMIDNEDVNASNDASQIKSNLGSVTHQISDRPAIVKPVAGRVYIQPQWLFDSVNQGELQPVSAYAPGEQLPPHLSPWGDRGTYDPEEMDDEDDESDAEEADASTAQAGGEEGEDDEGELEDAEQRELKLEAQGVKFSEAPASAKAKKRKSRKNEDEEKELRKTMMSNKERQLYEKVQGEADKKQARKETLVKKRKLLKTKN